MHVTIGNDASKGARATVNVCTDSSSQKTNEPEGVDNDGAIDGESDDTKRRRDEIRASFIWSDNKAPSFMNRLESSTLSLVID